MTSSGLVQAGAVRGLMLSAQGLDFNKWGPGFGADQLTSMPAGLVCGLILAVGNQGHHLEFRHCIDQIQW